MKFLKAIILLFIPALLFSQESTSVQFEKGRWSDVLQKARSENKFIFVDCSATWCVPCITMDQEVFANADVASALKDSFLFFRLQMDRTGNDNAEVKAKYSDAQLFQIDYKVAAYPTLLFFSASGKLLHKAVGYRNASEFIDLAKSATNPDKQYFTMLETIAGPKKQYTKYPELISLAKNVGEKDKAKELSRDYIHNYLLKLARKDFYTVDNIRFVLPVLKSSDQTLFKEIYDHQVEIDSACHKPGVGAYMAETGFKRGEIYPMLYTNPDETELLAITKTPDWKKINLKIKTKLGKNYNEKTLLEAKAEFYDKLENWEGYCDASLEIVERFDKIDARTTEGRLNQINGFLYDPVFTKVTNKNILLRALKMAETICKHEVFQNVKVPKPTDNTRVTSAYVNGYPNNIDTYANLLYKLGRKQEAIVWESKAVEIANEYKDNPRAKARIDEFTGALQKMKAGQPTW